MVAQRDAQAEGKVVCQHCSQLFKAIKNVPCCLEEPMNSQVWTWKQEVGRKKKQQSHLFPLSKKKKQKNSWKCIVWDISFHIQGGFLCVFGNKLNYIARSWKEEPSPSQGMAPGINSLLFPCKVVYKRGKSLFPVILLERRHNSQNQHMKHSNDTMWRAETPQHLLVDGRALEVGSQRSSSPTWKGHGCWKTLQATGSPFPFTLLTPTLNGSWNENASCHVLWWACSSASLASWGSNTGQLHLDSTQNTRNRRL